ncbi:MAG: hypothetical protein NT000_06195 [Proteobacteria bacterium]|nr:hypothetical protein [Pseudomonadota bacterium]
MSQLFIKHRVNAIGDLALVNRSWGVEIDLRSHVGQAGMIHLAHDPWTLGDNFEAWLKEFKRLEITGPIWLNTKEDGLENKIEELLVKFNLNDYIFLDTVLPTLVKKTQFEDKNRFAIRLSAYEPAAFVNCFRGKAEWVWVDCFQAKPISEKIVKELKSDFKICLVSPELHGKSLEDNISKFLPLYELADAICSKEPQVWLDASA